MTKEQENAINELQRMKMDKSYTESEYNAIEFAIQGLLWIERMQGLVLDLVKEKNDLIAQLENLKADKNKTLYEMLYHHSWFSDNKLRGEK